MSDPTDPPNKPSSPGSSRGPISTSSRSPSSGLHDDRDIELDFEADALLDSLLNDPFPVDPPPPVLLPSGPKLHEPAERHYPEDEVTMVGGGLDALLAQSANADSVAPPARPTAPAPSPSEVTVVGKSLDELLAQSVAESLPPTAGEEPPAPPPRPALPPRPQTAAPRPRVTPPPFSAVAPASGPQRRATPPPLPAVAPPSVTQTPIAPPVVTDIGHDDFTEVSDDEETRILRVPSELLESIEPVRPRQSAASAPVGPAGHPFEPESFVPPALFQDSLPPRGFDSQVATPMPDRGEPRSAAMPAAPRMPTLAAPFGEEAVTLSRPISPELTESERFDALPTRPPEPRDPSTHEGPPRAAPSSAPPIAVAASGGTIDPIAREAWIARAEWLESEAHAASDPQAKARALLVASEHWAIVGDVSRAREVATEATATARGMTMAGRQLRWLAALEQDHRAVASALELETRSASTPEARVHAAYLSAEVHRLCIDDAATARKKYELSMRAHATDPRAPLMKLAEQLAASAAPPKMQWPEADELLELAAATEDLVRFRSAAPEGDGKALGAFETARRALAEGDREGAGVAILELDKVEGLERPARWLAASLFAQDEKTRGRAIELLERLTAGGTDATAERARAARALEVADSGTLERALESGHDAFSAADRVALAVLGKGPSAPLEPLLEALANLPAGKALATAAVLAGSRTAAEPECGPEPAASALRLGFRLGRAGALGKHDLGWLESAVGAFATAHPEHPAARTLELEVAASRRNAQAIGHSLGEWPRPSHDPALQRDRELAAALIHELGGDTTLMRAAFERALSADPACEPAVRALIEGASAEQGAELIDRLGDAAVSGTPAALHFVEAALRRGGNDRADWNSALEKAVDADPKLVLPHRLGEHFARKKGDRERLLFWLRARRGLSQDRVELALDLVREALLAAPSEGDASVSLLRDAMEARPEDIAIAELSERVSPAGEGNRASQREAAAERATGPAKTRLLVDAALEYERAGDQPAAFRAAQAALAFGENALASALLERVAVGTPEATRLAEELLSRAKRTDDPLVERELYEQLSEIDSRRSDGSSALLWQRAILERSPRHLPALHRLQRAYVAGNRLDELEPVAATLAEALTGPEAVAFARLAARLRLRAGNWAGVRPVAEFALEADPNCLWALRALAAQARASDDPEALLRTEKRLHELSTRPLDRATSALRAAESAARLLRWDEAQTFLELALDHVPDHLVALTSLAEVLELAEEPAGAARAFEAFAEASRVDAHKVNASYQAGVLWLDHANQPERGRAALEQAVALDLDHQEAVARLQSIYVARGDRQRLAELLERRLERTTDPEERIAIEVARGRALAELGEPGAAKAALSAALDANPDHFDALEAFADLCLGEGDWLGAEQAFIRLARRAGDPERQAQIYRKLGELYDVAIPNPERAELAYQEVLKRAPDDAATVDRLVAVYARLGFPDRAVALESQLLERAETPETRRERTIRLARVLEHTAGDRKRAEATLDRARKEWPHDAHVLRALVELYQRGGEQRAAQVLLDRATADARRALVTGRFEPALFETLATVADLRGAPDAAAVAHATLAALAGDEMPVRGAGPDAGEARLDELLAPDLLVPALRFLLVKLGSVLDAAFPVDLRALRATALPAASAGYLTHVREVARAFALSDVEVLVSPIVGSTCLPASSSPPTLVFGQALLESPDEAARYVLLVRALKIVQARVATLARTPPIDLWPMIAAFLGLLAPSFEPQSVDARKLADARSKIQAELPAELDPVFGTLALEAVGAIGNRASQLSTAAYQLGNRIALLAVGDPVAVLRALALAGGSSAGPPLAGAERIKWIVRNAEARDLAIFSVSEQYAEARRQLGLALG